MYHQKDLLRQKTFSAGNFIINEGEMGHCAYLIQSGNVEVIINSSEHSMKICEYGPGELVGEMAMIDELPRTASVRALSDCTLIEISRNDFSQRLQFADPILNNVMKLILKRYRELLSKKIDPVSSSDYDTQSSTSIKGQNNTEIIDIFTKSYEIQQAIKNNDIIFYYQPIISSQTRKIAGFEALARWIHPEKGMIPPDKFIPLCEQNGLISELTIKAIRQVDKDFKKFQLVANANTTEDHLFISINLSVAGIENTTLLKTLEHSQAKRSLNTSLHIEIVESVLIEKPDVARNFITQCQALGISISLDDFGTGYSSLSYLQEFEFNTLKIDKRFVASMLTSKKSMVLVKMIAGLAKNLAVEVVAEGVENKKEFDLLKKMGINYIQGYYFSKPVSYDTAYHHLQNGIV